MSSFVVEELKAGNRIISHFVDNCTKDFNLNDWREFRERHSLFTDQYMFWLNQNNGKRMLMDTREFIMWLCDKIAQVSEREDNGQ